MPEGLSTLLVIIDISLLEKTITFISLIITKTIPSVYNII